MKICSCFSVLLFFGLVLCLLSTNRTNGQENNVCVNCQKYANSDCDVKSSGIGALSSSPKDKEMVRKLKEGEDFDNKFAACTLEDYKIVGDLQSYICFWSPSLRCQAVASKAYVDNSKKELQVCKTCGNYCGCTKSNGCLGQSNTLWVTSMIGIQILLLNNN